ncbi:hypothetical protein AJ79_09159 [Helicocarpus griseus UAMH5409]|uniref:Uncharacterized protein n=1 Tax=Helicocarpus griseus UAMH5409 TaxID=1447875 RepID=A0A2B7WLL0_9EURO|nr:hypothetical protein AJ79_09159 [Helicocarpus griseus UAMH5409]
MVPVSRRCWSTSQHRSQSPSPEEPLILKLPEEILIIILDLAASVDSWTYGAPNYDSGYSYTVLRSLLVVCRRFNRIATPLLYAAICIRARQPRGAIALHQTLGKEPLLRQYCRSFSIHMNALQFGRPKKYDTSMATDFASWLTKVRYLKICGGRHDEKIWWFLRDFVQHKGKIEHLCVGMVVAGSYSGTIAEHIDIPSLRSLALHGVIERKEHHAVLTPEELRTAPFTSLSLHNFEGMPDTFAKLIEWPKELHHLDFRGFETTRRYIDVCVLYPLFAIHRDTLTSISNASRYSTQLFNAAEFPNLRFLRLSRWMMRLNWVDPAADAQVLLAPKLEHFGWEFSTPEEPELWDDFGDDEEFWIREFARAAIARKVPLKTIEIIFSPDATTMDPEDSVYPWDRMDDINNVIRLHGVTLVYNEPPITRKDWLNEIRAFERRTMAEAVEGWWP